MKKSAKSSAISVRRHLFTIVSSLLVLACIALVPVISRVRANDSKIAYPVTKKVEVVDDYFGTKVPDPYRWLEDERSPETRSWVEAQNALTFSYLDKIPYREKLKQRLTQLYNYPRISAPFRRGNTYFFTKNDGLQNQNVYYIQKGLTGKAEEFMDPNKFSADGTTVLSAFSLSKDGKYVAYGMS